MSTYFGKLLRRLADARVEFILVGGLAANARGSARVTTDVDVSYGRSPANLERLVKALAPIRPYLRGAPPGLPFAWSVATLRAGLTFTLTTVDGSLDLLGEIVGGGTYEDLVAHSTVEHTFDRDIRVLDLPSLIRAKRAAGQPKDLEVVAELAALVEEAAKHDSERGR
jgi:hypothetical protein